MGLNILTLGSSKTYTNLVALGISSAVVDDTAKTITFTLAADGSQHTIHFDQPKDGVSITNISIDANNNLVCTMSDGTEYKSKIDLLDNVYTKTETDTLLLDKAEKNHNHDSAYASKDTEHEHSNKETLDKFGVNDGGKLTFNGDVVTPEAMDLGDYLKKTDAQNTYVEKETGKGLSENDFTTVLKDAYDKAVEDSHTHSNKSIIDKFSEDSDGKLLYDGQSIEADLSTVYKKTETYSQTESDDKFVAKESGKGLSANDLTNELKSSYDDAVTAKHTHENGTVLDGITAEKVEAWDKAEENVQSDWNETDDTADGFIKNKPTIPDITGLATETYVDNKVADYTKTVDLADIAMSGSYNDLADKPTIPSLDGYAKTSEIPSKVSQLENDSNYLSSIPEEYVTETELEAKGYLTEHQDISNLVEKEDGKGLSSNDYTTEEKNKLAGLENYNDTALSNRVKSIEDEVPNLATKTYVGEQISNADHLKREIVTEIPKPETADKNTIYMLKIESVTGNDKYREYLLIDGTVQCVGDTSVDLTDYAKTTDVDKKLNNKADKSEIPTTVAELTDSADYAKKTDLHSHENKTVLDGITSTKVSNWDSAKTHADSAHAPSNAQENVLETVKVNGTALEVSNKAVNVTVPTKVAELTDSADYAKTADVNNSISTLQTGKANASDLTAHTGDADIHVTAENKATWNTVSDKVDKEEGKGLSANDYTNEEKALVGTIKDKINKTSIATTLNDSVTDEQVASALLAKTELDKKVQKTSIVTELSDASTDDEVVGALTAYNELQKLESANKEQFATASGDYITVTDSVDGNIVELGIKGNSFQKTYRGVNLLNYNWIPTNTKYGVTITNNGDNSWTFSGSIADNTKAFELSGTRFTKDTSPKEFHKAGYYTMSVKGTTLADDNQYAYVTFYYNGKTYYNSLKNSSTVRITEEMLAYDDFHVLTIGFYIAAGSTLKTGTVSVQIEYSETATEFEPYVGGIPSPNPSYPQAINSVGDDGSLVVKSCGKNLIPYPYDDGVRTNVGLTTTSLPNGMVSVSGTNTGKGALFNFNYPTNASSLIKLDPNKTYAFFNPLKTDRKDQITLGVRWYLEGQELSTVTGTNTNIAVHGNSNGAVIRSGFSYAYVYLYGYNSGKTFNNVLFAPMLVEVNEDGTYPTDYEPYKSSTSTIPLSEPLRAIGDVKDEITYQDGKWGVLRRTGKYVIDSSTDIKARTSAITDKYRMSTTEISSKAKVVADNDTMPKMLCSHYNVVTTSDVWYCNGGITIDTKGDILVYDERYNTSDATLYKTWVSDNPVTIIYELATPVFEPFADQSLPYLSTYDGITNISNDDALSAEMTVKYPTTDVSGVGSRNESRIAELAKDTDDKFDDVNESLGALGKCKNLLKPTLQTTTHDGITCTNNGDGTYTLNGTCSVDSPKTTIILTSESMKIDEDVKFICCTQSGSSDTFRASVDYDDGTYSVDYGEGTLLSKGKTITKVSIIVSNGATVNNLVFKPMLTTNLSATYDDFVPYTGDGETLTHDVSALKNDLGASNAGAHNCVYRGKYLGNALTTEQKAQISAGTFNDLYIGDYWKIGGVNYRIAAFDYWLNSGDTQCTKHHVVIVPDTCLYTAKMNTTNVTTGAYIGSEMYTTNIEQAKTIINDAFGSANILSHRDFLANATKATTDPTYESSSSWYDSTVELMNERMVYGADVFHNIEVNGAIPMNYTIDKSQLPLFALEPSKICNRATWWLRDVVSSARFADVSNDGLATNSGASNAYGVRPAFGITG